MRGSVLFLFFIITSVCIKAQTAGNSISGRVMDSTSGTALEYATITLYATNSNVPLTGTVTDKNGTFIIKGLDDGTFTILFEFIGYKTFSLQSVSLNKNKTTADLKNILLARQKNTLQTVVVSGQTKLIENKIDKIVYNAEKDISSQTGVAADVLKKVPQVSIDADGNVQLAGSSGVRFLVNGKPSTAFGSSITEVLQSIPASQIKSIEVITNPGARYDAQGLGGIINIILKSNNAKGYNGNLSLTAGTRVENGSFNFNTRKNNLGINIFISGNKRLNAKTLLSSARVTNDSNQLNLLQQQGENKIERHGFQAGGGFDLTFRKYNNLTGSVSFNNFGNTASGLTNQLLEINKGSAEPVQLSVIEANNKFQFKNVDASLNFKKTFTKEDQELELGFNTSFGNNHQASANEQFSLPQDSLFYGTKSDNPGHERETEITLDYTQPLTKEVVLGIGSKASFDNFTSTSNILRYNPLIQIFDSYPSLNNNLDYKQQVYAAYSELSFPVGKLFQAKLGGRFERTDVNSFYSNAQQQVKTPGYNTFVPSIFFSKKIGEDQTIKLAYSKRIERPDYGDLNPFVNTNDPKNLSAGNPYLKPEIGHRFELGYSRDISAKGSVMMTLFYRINEDDIQPFIVYYPSYKVGDSVFNNVSVTTRQNIGQEKNMGLILFGDLHITSKLAVRSNVSLFKRHTINKVDKGYNSNSFNYRFNLNTNYQFTSTLLAEFFGNFNSARHEAQGNYPSFTTYTLALRKQFWNKKGSMAITANNFLNKNVTQKTNLFGPGFSVDMVRKIPFRSIGINFAWKFGKLEFKKENPEPDSNLNPTGD
ncbi:MAG: TonB-dependent receptor [Ginsengibacter sp.]